ncbi:MAG: hypothetical protein ACLPWF_04385 [Bryobacteraceae bacterium]
MKTIRSGSALAPRQQMQLFGYSCDQVLKKPHLLLQLLPLSLPLAIRNKTLHGIAGKVGHTARAPLLTHAVKLTEFVLRNPEVN